ncbi:MAG: hypothetical protein II816_04450, partial [Elusimicrobia bacterium]|nr:hypothetical protein [Elusimicrobiota bacterium]
LLNQYNNIRTGKLKEIESLLNSGRNQEALNLMRKFERTQEYSAAQAAIRKIQADYKELLADKEYKKISNNLELYLNFKERIEETIDAQNTNIEMIESKDFLTDMIVWINGNFQELLDMFKENKFSAEEFGFVYDEEEGKIISFINDKYENITRAIAKEINRRLASRDGYIKFSKEKKDEKGYERYNRVKEGALQILTRHLYRNIVVNEWVFDGDFETELNKTAYEIVYKYLLEIVEKIKEMSQEEYNSLIKNLSIFQKRKLNRARKAVMLYELPEISRQNIINETEILALIVGDFINICANFNLNIVGDKKIIVYSAAAAAGKDELTSRVFEKNGILEKYFDPDAKMMLFHTRDLRPGETQGEKYVFWKPDVLEEYANSEGEGKIKLVYVNGQLQGFVFGDKETVPVYEVDYSTGKVTDTQGEDKVVKGLNSLYNTNKFSKLEGGLAIALEAMKAHPDGTFLFISLFTEEQIDVRGENNKIIARSFSSPEELRLANEVMQAMIAENKGEIDLRDENVFKDLIYRTEQLAKTTNVTVIKKAEDIVFDKIFDKVANTGSCTIPISAKDPRVIKIKERFKAEFGNCVTIAEGFYRTEFKLNSNIVSFMDMIDVAVVEGKQKHFHFDSDSSSELFGAFSFIKKKYGDTKAKISINDGQGNVTILGDRYFECDYDTDNSLMIPYVLRGYFSEEQVEIQFDQRRKKIIFILHDTEVDDGLMQEIMDKLSKPEIDLSITPENLLSTALKNINRWLILQKLNFIGIFKEKPEGNMIVDCNDDNAIDVMIEAYELAQQGIKINMTILNSKIEDITDETGAVLYDSDMGRILELSKNVGKLKINIYKTYDEQPIDKTALDTLINEIKNKNIVGKKNKSFLYISPSLADGYRNRLNEYVQEGVFLSVSEQNIKSAIV